MVHYYFPRCLISFPVLNELIRFNSLNSSESKIPKQGPNTWMPADLYSVAQVSRMGLGHYIRTFRPDISPLDISSRTIPPTLPR